MPRRLKPGGYCLLTLLNSTNSLQNLCEILDGSGRPICLLPPREALRQGLIHNSLAILLRDAGGKWLFCQNEAGQICFSAMGIAPAGQSREESCAALLAREWHCEASALRQVGLCRPCPQSGHSFAYIYTAAVNARLLDLDARRVIFADGAELKALAAMACPLCPLLELLAAKGFPDCGEILIDPAAN